MYQLSKEIRIIKILKLDISFLIFVLSVFVILDTIVFSVKTIWGLLIIFKWHESLYSILLSRKPNKKSKQVMKIHLFAYRTKEKFKQKEIKKKKHFSLNNFIALQIISIVYVYLILSFLFIFECQRICFSFNATFSAIFS